MAESKGEASNWARCFLLYMSMADVKAPIRAPTPTMEPTMMPVGGPPEDEEEEESEEFGVVLMVFVVGALVPGELMGRAGTEPVPAVLGALGNVVAVVYQ
ncbi:hypothetical protein HDV05_005209 [Chytridiales sp. JEL 0842]|nr:hypothetical protein HDV05_005209 [Chytridiales sp. JEL 0842]